MRIHASFAVGVITLAVLAGCAPRSRDPYETCVVSADCNTSSDRCLNVVNGSASDSICSTPCSTSSQCPFDRMGAIGDCRVLGSGGANCFQACATDSDCNFGFGCVDPDGGSFDPICLPIRGGSGTITVAAYEACNSSRLCTTGTRCFNVQNGSRSTDLCTETCFSDSDCPLDIRGGNGACLDITGGSNGVCFERCRGDLDCRTGFFCDSQTAGGIALPVTICLP